MHLYCKCTAYRSWSVHQQSFALKAQTTAELCPGYTKNKERSVCTIQSSVPFYSSLLNRHVGPVEGATTEKHVTYQRLYWRLAH